MGVMHKNTPTTGLTSPAAAAETAVYSTPALQAGQGLNVVGIAGTIYITIGTSGTAVTLKARQGTGLAGAVLQSLPPITVVAGSTYAISFGFTDTTAWLEQAGGGTYTVTAQVTGGAAVSTVGALDIEVIV